MLDIAAICDGRARFSCARLRCCDVVAGACDEGTALRRCGMRAVAGSPFAGFGAPGSSALGRPQATLTQRTSARPCRRLPADRSPRRRSSRTWVLVRSAALLDSMTASHACSVLLPLLEIAGRGPRQAPDDGLMLTRWALACGQEHKDEQAHRSERIQCKCIRRFRCATRTGDSSGMNAGSGARQTHECRLSDANACLVSYIGLLLSDRRATFLSDRRRTPLPVRSCFAAPVAAMKAVILLAAVAGAVRSRGAWAWPAHQPWPAHRFAGAAACARRRAGLGCQAARCARAVRAAGASAWLAFRLVRNATPCTKRWQGVGQPPPRCDALSGLERAPRDSTRGCLAKPPAAYTERRTNCRVARLALTRARASSLPAAERARALAGPQDAAGHHHHRRAEPRCVEASERPGCATLISVAD